MTLLLSHDDVAPLMTTEQALAIVEDVAREELRGDVVHMPSFGGGSTRQRTLRTVGGCLYGLGRMGIRSGNVAQLFDTATGELLCIMGYPFSTIRVGATLALGARELSRPDCHVVGLLGSGRNALSILEYMCAVRPIERVESFSPTREHREAVARRASSLLGIPVTPHDSPEPVIAAAEIIVGATDARQPVIRFADLRPGMHVSSMGRTTELDQSVYTDVDQFVVPSRVQEIESNEPEAHPKTPGGGPLYRLMATGRFDPATDMALLGSILNGDVPPRNGPTDITLFRDSRGGVGDVALASWAYERARELGRGTEFAF